MFNLIMLGVNWDDGHANIELNRIFEYTEDRVADQFRENGSPKLDRLIQLPCLFMQEGIGDETCYVGKVNRARIVGRQVGIEYTMDVGVLPFQNRVVYENRMAIDMRHDFEFSRNHWAVKDTDLYQFLMRNVRNRRQLPSVFHIDDHENINTQMVSAMMPFETGFNKVYTAIRKAATGAGMQCKRADDFWENAAIIQDVVALIDKSKIVVCDCSGRNPNVFYEAGIAHTLGREVILITQSVQDIPFDLRHLRHIPYLNNAQGRSALVTALQSRMETIMAT